MRSENLIRTSPVLLRAERTEEKAPKIEGYFIVFNEETELFPGAFEEIRAEALKEFETRDVRALINHDTALVLGRTSAGTLRLRIDEKGLFGSIDINQNDMEAMNLYARVQRGDVSQCSFGFQIVNEEMLELETGYKWIIKNLILHEVSVVTFPAYESTSISARSAEIEERKQELLAKRKNDLKEKLYVKTINA